MENWMHDDELTEDDLKFLGAWEKMGQSDTADAEYAPEMEEPDKPGGIVEGSDLTGDHEGEADESIEGGTQGDGDDEGDGTRKGEGQKPGDSEDSDEVDESKMDISNIEHGDDEEGDFSDSDVEPPEDFDDSGEPETQPDHLESGEGDPVEGDSELEYDDLAEDESDSEESTDDSHEHAQIEEDDGEGERGNSDEQRESDEPIGNSEHDPEADDAELDAPDDEEDDQHEKQVEDEADRQKREQELNAEGDSDFEGDAQQELEDHLKESEPQTEETDSEGHQEPPEGFFESVPDPGEACTNHCEDNPTEDHDGECPHCKARIKLERELWGVIAQDRHGTDILPGDKLRVALPMPFTTMGAMLTANVPNLAVEPNRVAQSTAGEIDSTVCWLSGHAISRFTGWHMADDGAIWTFQLGKMIRFVEKIGEPEYQRHGSNDLDGDQLDMDIEQLLKEPEDEDDEPETELEEQPEDDSDSEIDEGIEKEEEDEPEEQRHDSSGLTQAQHKRYENLVGRIDKKIRETFGNTLEGMRVEDIVMNESYSSVRVKVISRGVTFTFWIEARRYNDEDDSDVQNWEE